jgi:hypothetical protein
MDMNDARLCYLQASRVVGPTGRFGSMPVRGRGDASLGTVDGVLIDPERRCVRFLIVQDAQAAPRQYLLPVDESPRVERQTPALRVDCDDLLGCELFDPRSVDEYTEEDAVAPTLRRYLS